jgi:hypothetical protein
MLNVSRNFKNDIISTNQTLKPVLVITDSVNQVLFTLTQDKDELFDIDGNSIRSINAISRVSNVKTSTDYDSKTLKINRLRCTLYNYYDVNTKLSEYINTNVIGKNLYLFYKSPSTNIINIQNQLNKSECALIYNGEINRVNFNNSTIDFSAEDKTQIKIADKTVPNMSVDKLQLEIRERLIEEYKDAEVVPMTFGKVDKAPVLPYLENNNDKVMNILLDNQPTAGNYPTSRIPKILDLDVYANSLYVKKNNQYLVLEHKNQTEYQQNLLNSKFKLYTFNSSQNNYLIPELQNDFNNESLKLWSCTGFNQRLVESVYASDGSILDVKNIEVEDLTNQEFENIERINDNNNYEKNWYRIQDEIQSNSSDFDTNLKHYANDTVPGSGRWIILKFEKGVNNNLMNRDFGQNFINILGNSHLFADFELYQSLDNSTPNDSSLDVSVRRTGFFAAPISFQIWKSLITNDTDNESVQANLNRILLTTDADVQIAEESDSLGFLQNSPATTDDPFRYASFSLRRDDVYWSSKGYWGSKGQNNSITNNPSYAYNLDGLYYGDISSDANVPLNEADSHDLIAIFEYFPPFWNGVNSFQQGLKMNNIGMIHNVLIEDLQEEEIYASIIGRKNNYYTEEIEYSEPQEIIPSFNFIISGLNDTKPDPQTFIDNVRNITNYMLGTFLTPNNTLPNGAGAAGYTLLPNSTQAGMDMTYNFNEQSFFQILQEYEWLDDSALFGSFEFWKNYVWKIFLAPARMFDVLNVNQNNQYLGNINHNYLYTDLYNIQLYGPWPNMGFTNFVLARIFEYVYQQDFGYNGFSSNTFNLSNFYQNMEGYRWNDFDIQNFDDWIDNFYIYYDNLTYALCKTLAESLSESWSWWINQEIVNNYDDYIDTYPFLGGISYLQNTELNIDDLGEQVYNYAQLQLEGLEPDNTQTDGIIKKPSDIVMNILTNEMEYGKLLSNQVAGFDIIVPDYNKFDMDSIIESRNAHNWEMGFSVNEKTEGKKLIENILKESKSYPRFTSDGKFGLLTIKESYTYDDIDRIININDILTYKFEQTKREDITTSVAMFYRYDYGQEKYNFTINKSINDIFPDYSLTGYDNYNILPIDGHKDIELKYHTDTASVDDFANYTLMNNCNPHNMVNMKLPLNYMDLEVGDKIHIPLINNEKIFNIDYSKVDFANGQPIYPLWIIMETNIGVDSIAIKAYQLHYLGTDGNHGFELPDQEYQVIGNTNIDSYASFTNGENIPCWNYNPNATLHNGYEIPYFDLNGDGFINVADITMLVNHITGNQQLTHLQKKRLIYRSDGTLKENDIINVIDIISMINIITQ